MLAFIRRLLFGPPRCKPEPIKNAHLLALHIGGSSASSRSALR